MKPRRPRPLWPLLTAALIGLPMLYVASFGPACWLTAHTAPYGFRPSGPPGLMRIYWPLGAAYDRKFAADAIRWWARLGAPAAHWIELPMDATGYERVAFFSEEVTTP